MRAPMSRGPAWLEDPLVHFAVLGALTLGLWQWTRTPDASVIVVEASRVQSLSEAWALEHGRAPDAATRREMVEALARDEMLLREARRLGLEEADPIVRRRLIQKMRFVLEDEAERREPETAELVAWLESHPERYRRPGRRGFVQVFISGDDPERRDALLAQLEAGEDPATLGDPFVHGQRFADSSQDALARSFGADFAEALAQLAPGQWAKLRSSWGWHLVRVDAKVESRPAELEEVRGQVRADWMEAQREREGEAAIQRLTQQYEIRVEGEAESP